MHLPRMDASKLKIKLTKKLPESRIVPAMGVISSSHCVAHRLANNCAELNSVNFHIVTKMSKNHFILLRWH